MSASHSLVGRKSSRLPISFLVMEGLALLCLVPAVASLAGYGSHVHPLLGDTAAGITLLVTAISLLVSGIFPLVLRGMINREEAAAAGK